MLVTPYCGLISSLEPEIENLPKDGHLQLADTNPFHRWCPLIRGSTVCSNVMAGSRGKLLKNQARTFFMRKSLSKHNIKER